MSEQTPDPTNDLDADLGGDMGSDAEPSMEDILASIRKIIAEDADPLPLDGPSEPALSEPTAERILPEAVDVSADEAPDTLTLSEDDALDIDALLDSMDAEEDDLLPAKVETASVRTAESLDDFDLTDLSDFDDILSDLAIPDVEETAVELTADAQAPSPVEASSEQDDLSDLSADLSLEDDELLGDLMADLTLDTPELDPVTEPDLEVDQEPVDIMPEDTVSKDSVPADTVNELDDMELVKSLMADLTDEDLDFTALEAAESAEQKQDNPDDDIFDDILNMTIEDEIALTTAPDAAPAEDVDFLNDILSDDGDAPVQTPTSAPKPSRSLADIAAEAEADATAASLAGAAKPVAALTTLPEDDVEPAPSADDDLSDLIIPDVPDEPVAEEQLASVQPDPEEMETPMPSAARKDAILDDVTEEATKSAFAELNSLVEEKAVFEERGPRIGDLVQEALKPMLKEWLDEHLQSIVERAVAKEVKRISSGK